MNQANAARADTGRADTQLSGRQTSTGVIAVVVVNYGSSALLAERLTRLGRPPHCRIIVVDNHSSATEAVRVEQLSARHGWQPVLLETNTGFAGGVNAGLAAARAAGVEAVLLLNPDVSIDAETVAALHDHVRRNPLELVAPRVLRPDGRTWSAGSAVDLRSGRMRGRPGLAELAPYERPWLSGACLALSSELLDRIGPLSNDYFLYWEDVELSFRVRQVGGSLRVREDLTVVHDEGGTQAVRPGQRLSERYYYFNIRNRLLFGSRWLSRRQLVAWLLRTGPESWAILTRGGRRQLLQSPRPLLAAITGAAAGLALGVRALTAAGPGPRPADPLPADPVRDRTAPDRPGSRDQAGSPDQPGSPDQHSSPDRPVPADAAATPITALMSFPATPPRGNPYRLLLERGLRRAPGLTIKHFSWRTALLADYDVFHVHWPEILLQGRTPVRTLARRVLFVVFMTKLRVRRIPIVRTLHNLELPRDIDRVEVALLRATERRTTLWIRLNASTELPAGRHGVTVLHGHYRDWYADHPRSAQIPGRLVFYGLVRRYKGVPGLVRAFAATDDPDLSLRVLGKPSTPELAAEISSAAGRDPRIGLRLEFVDDPELVAAVTAAELVVLPYREMHNSAAVLTALSLDRPVLVPDNEVNRKLAAEVGPGWIHTYPETLTATDLTRTLSELRSAPPTGRPDLSRRDWDLGGIQHADAYRTARALLHPTEAPKGSGARRRTKGS